MSDNSVGETLPEPTRNYQYVRKVKKQKKVEKSGFCCRMLLRVLFSHLGLLGLVVGYLIFGAWLFVRIESPEEKRRQEDTAVKANEINETAALSRKRAGRF